MGYFQTKLYRSENRLTPCDWLCDAGWCEQLGVKCSFLKQFKISFGGQLF